MRWLFWPLAAVIVVFTAAQVFSAVRCLWYTTCRHGQPVLISGICICAEPAR